MLLGAWEAVQRGKNGKGRLNHGVRNIVGSIETATGMQGRYEALKPDIDRSNRYNSPASWSTESDA